MENKTFQIELSDEKILQEAKYELSEVYSEIRNLFVNSDITDKSKHHNELIFETENNNCKRIISDIFEKLLYHQSKYRDYIKGVITYYGSCKITHDLSVETREREMARIHEKALHDDASALANAKNEGRTEERNLLIEKMRKRGMSEDEIYEFFTDKMT